MASVLRIIRHIILFPIYFVQAAYIYRFTPVLPEAAGDRQMHVGQGKPLRLLLIGDSSAAGVGAETQDEVLLGRLCRDLGREWNVTGTLWAKSGGTAASTLQLLKEMPPEQFDLAIVTLGVNDAKNGVRFHTWVTGYTKLLKCLQKRHGVPRIIVSGLAPVRDFPLLPFPLRHFLGDRAEWFDSALETLVAGMPRVEYAPLDMKVDPTKMSADGFHPGPEAYAEWARRLAGNIRGTPSASDVVSRNGTVQ